MKSQILILDYGSQYTQLIARVVRELGVYCEILPGNASWNDIKKLEPKAVILSGGPASVYSSDSPKAPFDLFESGVPIFAICYGMQLVASMLGGKVEGWGSNESSNLVTSIREFGPAEITIDKAEGIFSSLSEGDRIPVWMSHGDKVTLLPPGFTITASSSGSPIAAFYSREKHINGVQFHPEVHHTPSGKKLIENFLFKEACLKKDWNMKNFIDETVSRISNDYPVGNVVCGLSGGVDSTVAAQLVSKAISDRLYCIFVDNGLLRQNEADRVMESMEVLGLNVKKVDARDEFLDQLSGVTDPEKKRKIIGRVFIDVFEREAASISDVKFLVQGTLYPDVIESVSVIGGAATIKSHHNVGGLKENMQLGLIEPLRELFKDEVREIGRTLGIPAVLINRQPFPGPGLAVRILGEITNERLNKLRIADSIVEEEVIKAGLWEKLWQTFAVLLPVNSVGVMGDGRTFDECIALRIVTSRDGMTADWYLLPEDVLRKISTRIVNETPGVNRVVLDISSKPPATIEWE
ncbi:MAG TPA: glutamine-hydrolyzing GMP synthase [Oligoflexia bacterium]|nr:glutamine-hydrolyzing GMP synthase [Oligoflexia bacterium]HMP49164.1 glutamine-hydrolyzing GMP synthase [Oligoflexia bacterium]